MLQQTQVVTVIPYYQRFLERFPTVQSLAQAHVDEVMPLWSGLGYYRRARHLHECARQVATRFLGQFPTEPELLATLPGIGRSTAAAISVFAFGTRAAILDGNVKRVLSRAFGVEGWPNASDVEKKLWSLAASLLPAQNIEAYTQGLMDLGASVCTRARPRCEACPWQTKCVAHLTQRTQELPTKNPKKTGSNQAGPRIRHAHMLAVLCGSHVLLEKRPPIGIWGGLWSLPEFPSLEALTTWEVTQQRQTTLQHWPSRRHAFTHYTLDFTPHILRVDKVEPMIQSPSQDWFDLESVPTLALPTPIRQLLHDLSKSEFHPRAGS